MSPARTRTPPICTGTLTPSITVAVVRPLAERIEIVTMALAWNTGRLGPAAEKFVALASGPRGACCVYHRGEKVAWRPGAGRSLCQTEGFPECRTKVGRAA